MPHAATSVEARQFINLKQDWQFVPVEHHLRNASAAFDKKRLIVVVDDDVYLVFIPVVNCTFDDICVKPLLFRFKPLEQRNGITFHSLSRKAAARAYMSVYAPWHIYLNTDRYCLSATLDYRIKRSLQVISCRKFYTLLWRDTATQYYFNVWVNSRFSSHAFILLKF